MRAKHRIVLVDSVALQGGGDMLGIHQRAQLRHLRGRQHRRVRGHEIIRAARREPLPLLDRRMPMPGLHRVRDRNAVAHCQPSGA
jgi:hypothetical protein